MTPQHNPETGCPLFHDESDSVCLEYDDDPFGNGCRLCGHEEACHGDRQAEPSTEAL